MEVPLWHSDAVAVFVGVVGVVLSVGAVVVAQVVVGRRDSESDGGCNDEVR